MSPDAEAKISDEVQRAIEQPVKLSGFEYSSVLEFVQKEIHNSKHDTEDLMFNLRHALMPVFEELLQKDIQANRTQ